MESLRCLFVSDLHGHAHRYETLFRELRVRTVDALFIGGDLLPGAGRSGSGLYPQHSDFLREYLAPRFTELKGELGEGFPHIFIIPGNDDRRSAMDAFGGEAFAGLWKFIPGSEVPLRSWRVFGYPWVPPTPFRLKDWERYDVSRFVEPGCIAPEDGTLTMPRDDYDLRYRTIMEDLEAFAGGGELHASILLMHTPPYQTALDRAALDGITVDHAPVDVHVGSVALRRFILEHHPPVTLHGHVHESARLTGSWKDRLGETWCLSAAHDGRELALVSFDPLNPEQATRELL